MRERYLLQLYELDLSQQRCCPIDQIRLVVVCNYIDGTVQENLVTVELGKKTLFRKFHQIQVWMKQHLLPAFD